MRRKILLLIGIGVLLLIVMIVFDFTVECPPITVLPDGSIVTIAADNHSAYAFRTRHYQNVGGNFSTNLTIAFYIMTMSQLQIWNTTAAPSSYVWTTGLVTSGPLGDYLCRLCNSLTPTAPPGSDYIVIYNPSRASTASVNIIFAIIVQTCFPPFSPPQGLSILRCL